MHDFAARQSFVTLAWENDATKRITLPVPFGTGLEAVREEAEKALGALSAETASLAVHSVK